MCLTLAKSSGHIVSLVWRVKILQFIVSIIRFDWCGFCVDACATVLINVMSICFTIIQVISFTMCYIEHFNRFTGIMWPIGIVRFFHHRLMTIAFWIIIIVRCGMNGDFVLIIIISGCWCQWSSCCNARTNSCIIITITMTTKWFVT